PTALEHHTWQPHNSPTQTHPAHEHPDAQAVYSPWTAPSPCWKSWPTQAEKPPSANSPTPPACPCPPSTASSAPWSTTDTSANSPHAAPPWARACSAWATKPPACSAPGPTPTWPTWSKNSAKPPTWPCSTETKSSTSPKYPHPTPCACSPK